VTPFLERGGFRPPSQGLASCFRTAAKFMQTKQSQQSLSLSCFVYSFFHVKFSPWPFIPSPIPSFIPIIVALAFWVESPIFFFYPPNTPLSFFCARWGLAVFNSSFPRFFFVTCCNRHLQSTIFYFPIVIYLPFPFGPFDWKGVGPPWICRKVLLVVGGSFSFSSSPIN